MPQRPLRPCSAPGCPARVEKGRCAAHQTAAHQQREEHRGTRHERGYGADWSKLRAAILPDKIREANGKCHLCGELVQAVKAPHPKAPSLDHITPKSMGGTDDPSNLALAHFGCNSARRNRALPPSYGVVRA